MADYTIFFTAEVADVDGNIATIKIRDGFVPDTTTLAALETLSAGLNTALAPATNGKVIRRGVSVLLDEAQILPGTTPPTDATYPSVTDGARLNFSNAQGSTMHVTVPAPTETTFLTPPQRDYVDPAGDASALIDWIKAHISDAGDNLYNLYQGGTKVGRGARRRRPPKAGLS